MSRDIASFLVPNHMPQMWNKKEINNELIMLQQMCQMFGKPYSISFATQYLKKLNSEKSKLEFTKNINSQMQKKHMKILRLEKLPVQLF